MRLRTVTIFSLLVGAVVAASAASPSFTPSAGAAPGVSGQPRVYYAEAGGPNPGVWWRNLDGTGSPTRLATTGASATDVGGLVLDPRRGYAVWTNCGAQLTISRARLDGTAASDLTTTTSGGCPWGLAIDQAAEKIYYLDWTAGGMHRINLDGSGRQALSPTGVSAINSPADMIIDPVLGYIYWSNDNPGRISRVSLSTLAGSDVATTGVTIGSANALAIDRANGKLYWTDFARNSAGSSPVGVANLDGSGSGQAITPGSPRPYGNPQGMAIDVANSRIYFASDDKITRMSMTGTGAVDIHSKAGTTVYNLAILAPPSNTVAPTVSGSATVGSTLTCGNGTWEMDRQEQKWFNAPESFSYSWLKDGSATPGTASTLTASAGVYTCLVTATNEAGTNTVASSNSVTVTNGATTTVAPTTVPAATTVPTATTVASTNGSTTNTAATSNTVAPTKSTKRTTATTVAVTASTAAAATTTTVPAATTTTEPTAPESRPGVALVTVGGSEIPVKVSRSDNRIVVTAGELTGTISGITADGKALGLDADGNLRLTPGDKVDLTVQGLGSGAQGTVRMYSKGTDLGTFRADGSGSASGAFAVPGTVEDGDHTLVVLSTGADGRDLTLALGFKVGAAEDGAGISRVILVILLLAVLLAVFIPTTLRRRRRAAPSP